MAFTDYQQLVSDMVRDSATVVDTAARDRAIEQARVRYSADALRTLVADVTWPQAGYSAPAPEGWNEEAWVKQAEHPIGQQPPSFVDLSIMAAPGEGGAVAWSLASPVWLPADAVIRLTYTAGHELRPAVEATEETPAVPGADTIPVKHRLAVASYAASLLCRQLAAYYSGQRESAIGADSSRTETRAREYAARAKEYRAAYYADLGVADPAAQDGGSSGGGTQAAGAVGSWPGRARHSLTPRGAF
jgi:hypothetical protein